MSEMVERVARAMFAKIDPELLVNYDPDDERAPYVDGRVDVDALARAAIAAMRDLPDNLWDEGGALDSDVIGHDPSPEACWHAVIDAALA